MKSSTKYLLIGGALVLVGVGAFFVFRKKGGTNKEPEKPNDEVEDDKIVDDEYEDVLTELSFDEIEELCRYGENAAVQSGQKDQFDKYCN
jgi:hypothetical protein